MSKPENESKHLVTLSLANYENGNLAFIGLNTALKAVFRSSPFDPKCGRTGLVSHQHFFSYSNGVL